jgi:NADH pyrophosphatase NudC (nudix superfamily)
LLKSDTPYSTKAKSIAEEIAASQKEIETATWNHFSEVRKICDAKQKEKFDDIVDDILRMMAPPPHGEHHP